MNTKLVILIIVVVLILLLVAYVVSIYNRLVNARNKVLNQFSQIEIQLKRRTDLIPNLIETVKGYTKHEKGTFTAVVEARNQAMSANSINDKITANNQLTTALNKLFALAESYPELKANENFLALQTDLRDTEDKISYSRQFYNDSAMNFNNLVQKFPTNIIANAFKFKAFDYFAATEEEKQTPKVNF